MSSTSQNITKKELTAFQKGMAIAILCLACAFGMGSLVQAHRSDINSNKENIGKTDLKLESFISSNKSDHDAIKNLLQVDQKIRTKEREEFIELRVQFKSTAGSIERIEKALNEKKVN